MKRPIRKEFFLSWCKFLNNQRLEKMNSEWSQHDDDEGWGMTTLRCQGRPSQRRVCFRTIAEGLKSRRASGNHGNRPTQGELIRIIQKSHSTVPESTVRKYARLWRLWERASKPGSFSDLDYAFAKKHDVNILSFAELASFARNKMPKIYDECFAAMQAYHPFYSSPERHLHHVRIADFSLQYLGNRSDNVDRHYHEQSF